MNCWFGDSLHWKVLFWGLALGAPQGVTAVGPTHALTGSDDRGDWSRGDMLRVFLKVFVGTPSCPLRWLPSHGPSVVLVTLLFTFALGVVV